MPSPHDPRQNHLLAVLPADACERVFPHLELIPMPLGHVVYEPGIHMGDSQNWKCAGTAKVTSYYFAFCVR